MKAHFGRKLRDIEELREATLSALHRGVQGVTYRITKEVELCDAEFKTFALNFIADQPWITPEDGGIDTDGTTLCIRVKNKDTLETVLVNSEGYGYPRYTAIEIE
jgi:hypothetical protein